MSIVQTKLTTTFKLPVLFSCPENCGLCCSYKVHVLQNDIDRIEKFVKPQKKFAEDGGLIKENGFCGFLDGNNRCSIYEYRPQYCRTFPFYIEADSEIDVDLSCPGIGQGETLTYEYFKQFLSDSEQIGVYQGKGRSFLSEAFAKSHLNFISRDDFREIGLQWFDELNGVESIADISQSAQVCARHKSPVLFERQQLFAEFFDVVQSHNIHLSIDGTLIRYSFNIRSDTLTIDGCEYSLAESESFKSSYNNTECLNSIRRYLEIWFRRSIFYRFCVINSLNAPMFYSPNFVAFTFIAELLEKITKAGNILSIHWSGRGEQINEVDMLKESIMLFEGRLRTKCRTVNIETC